MAITGSLVNHLSVGGGKDLVPVVGMGATHQARLVEQGRAVRPRLPEHLPRQVGV
jgi:hypothetical protein